ncbi:hypothetical protein [Rheinheimera sp.]|uniref:hypothetical protein n=1 Tax=Rheinheimera sp. TaxID=1869214 RepID=UPI0040483815
MKKLTIRMPDDKASRLKALAQSRNISVNKLIEELSTIALTEYDAQHSGNRFDRSKHLKNTYS